jgi:hypothetical protein
LILIGDYILAKNRESQHATVDKTQRQRFIEAAREAGASEDGAVFDENLKRITKAKPKGDPKTEN